MAKKEPTYEYSGSEPYSPHEMLVYWILERETIRRKKESSAEKPWSDDPTFQTVYFCNVNREDDKTTVAIRKMYSEWSGHPLLIPNLCVARMVNYPPTLRDIGFLNRADRDTNSHILDAVLKRQNAGKQVWSGAYLITTHGQAMSKAEYCSGALEATMKGGVPLRAATNLATLYGALRAFDGFGPFLSAQVVADVKNTPGHKMREADDWWTFCAHGPGSLRGLGWYFGEQVTPSKFPARAIAAYQKVQRSLEDTNHPHAQDVIDILCMQNFQNCLCEFDKYCRVRTGTGRSKRKYSGAA